MAIGELKDEKALHARLVGGQISSIAGTHLRLSEVILRNLTTHRYSGEIRQIFHHGVRNGTADIVEVDVDS